MSYKLSTDGLGKTFVLKKTEQGTIVFSADGTSQEAKEYLTWLAEGNTPEPADVIPVTPEYITQRLAAYPSIADQMDMQYHDAVNGTTVWQDTIAAVKAQYPKGNT